MLQNPSQTAISITILAFLLLGSCTVFDPASEFRKALLKEKEWKLAEAEQIIHNLNPESNREIATAYVRILLKRGELKRVNHFLSILPETIDLTTPELLYQSALVYYYRGELSRSKNLVDKLRYLAKMSNDTLSLARAFNVSGRIAFNEIDYKHALEYQIRSMELARIIGDKQSEADALRQIGVLKWYNLKYTVALKEYFEPALALYRQTGDKSGEATTLSNMGLVYKDQDKFENSVRFCLQSFDIRRHIGDRIGLADSYYFLSNILAVTGWEHTFRYFFRRKSLELSLKTGYKWGAEVAARSLVTLDNTALPVSEYFETQVDSLAFQSGEGRLYKVYQKASMAYLSGSYEKAAALSRDLISLDDSLNYRQGLVSSYLLLGNSYLKMRQFFKAEANLIKAKSMLAHSGDPLRMINIEYARALIRMETHQTGEAKEALKRLAHSVDSLYQKELQNLSADIFLDRSISLLVTIRSNIYNSLIRLLYQTNDKALFAYLEREKYAPFLWVNASNHFFEIPPESKVYNNFFRSFKQYDDNPDKYDDIQPLIDHTVKLLNEHLGQISIPEKFTDRIDSINNVATQPELQSILNQNEAFIHYHFDGQRILAHVVRKDTSITLVLSSDSDHVDTTAKVFYEAILRGKNDRTNDLWIAPARYLYTMLIQPLESNGSIKHGDHLLISPHRFIRQIPFQALLHKSDDESDHFLIQDYDLTIVPSATFLLENNRVEHRKPGSILAVAPAVRSLPFTMREIESIPYPCFSKHQILTGRQATSGTVFGAMQNYDVVHFAGHISVNRWFPLSSVMEFYDRPVKLFEWMQNRLKAQLVILSACYSGPIAHDSNKPSREDFNGFSQIFLLSGSKNVIATNWLVEDETTAFIMDQFYRQLVETGYVNAEAHQGDQATNTNYNRPFSEALSRAQRTCLDKMRKKGTQAHPFYWAAFTLTGSGK